MILRRILKLFNRIEDFLYLSVLIFLLLLAGTVIVQIVSAFFSLQQLSASGILAVLEKILLVLIIISLIHTIRQTIEQQKFRPISYLVVGLIASIRRILILSVESNQLLDRSFQKFEYAVWELIVLGILSLALVFGIYLLHKVEFKIKDKKSEL